MSVCIGTNIRCWWGGFILMKETVDAPEMGGRIRRIKRTTCQNRKVLTFVITQLWNFMHGKTSCNTYSTFVSMMVVERLEWRGEWGNISCQLNLPMKRQGMSIIVVALQRQSNTPLLWHNYYSISSGTQFWPFHWRRNEVCRKCSW